MGAKSRGDRMDLGRLFFGFSPCSGVSRATFSLAGVRCRELGVGGKVLVVFSRTRGGPPPSSSVSESGLLGNRMENARPLRPRLLRVGLAVRPSAGHGGTREGPGPDGAVVLVLARPPRCRHREVNGGRTGPGASVRSCSGEEFAERGGVLVGGDERVDQHEPSAVAVAPRGPEAGASVDPLRPDLLADDEFAGAAQSADESPRGLVVLRGAHSPCPFSVMTARSPEQPGTRPGRCDRSAQGRLMASSRTPGGGHRGTAPRLLPTSGG
ncbi:hypothetical protein LX15_006355 [Streptoalloteichus tenebrarius]|uniref:Uncharacterized protein n=1 Tax=Streptoalloteichus tenebrarius (strain ATCC 17920 / DSM 40477 / JCM 4838 / CBS 697.72 / NBRC 16177 / NCIMB 11028 / NRRL B-12390 / A12253. 1 / ISP 5477) TaxID=1933 RepID=A0ABT1I471_STRSD|nr:hypothetical protein [Streptoalloteichus tenebrarius]MCP2262614.1 hypothetical protein [Streptoalloteichus tenebrarius]